MYHKYNHQSNHHASLCEWPQIIYVDLKLIIFNYVPKNDTIRTPYFLLDSWIKYNENSQVMNNT